ncbi:extracellular solute-binding protein [Paenibacillus sp. FSL W8-0426]|uniref:ABC transporter substrate-binding protein n=1 Tax=Paenibacillus sp. FSL W8-0426 TaxID=2921714 RepID=UPI0030D8C58B
MKRRHQVVLFAVLLLSLTILSPSFDFRGTPLNPEKKQEEDSFPGSSSRNEEQQAPVEIVVSMSSEDFKPFQEIAKQVAELQHVEIQLRNVEPDTYKQVLNQEFALGEGGDVILMDNAEVQHYAKRGNLYPLNGTSLAKSAGDTVLRFRKSAEWNGYQWAMPFDFDAYVVASRPFLINKAGLDSPLLTAEQWNAFVKGRGASSQEKLLGLDASDPFAISAWLNQIHPKLVPTRMNPANWAEPNKEEREALQLLNTMPKYVAAFDGNETSATAANPDQLPMVVTSLAQWKKGSEASKKGGGILGSQDSKASVTLAGLAMVHSRSFVITAGSSVSEHASKWIEGMTSVIIQAEWSSRTGRMPARQEQLDAEMEMLENQFKLTNGETWGKGESMHEIGESQLHDYSTSMEQLFRGKLKAEQYVKRILEIHANGSE